MKAHNAPCAVKLQQTNIIISTTNIDCYDWYRCLSM